MVRGPIVISKSRKQGKALAIDARDYHVFHAKVIRAWMICLSVSGLSKDMTWAYHWKAVALKNLCCGPAHFRVLIIQKARYELQVTRDCVSCRLGIKVYDAFPDSTHELRRSSPNRRPLTYVHSRTTKMVVCLLIHPTNQRLPTRMHRLLYGISQDCPTGDLHLFERGLDFTAAVIW